MTARHGSPELEHFFATRGRMLLLSFYARMHQFKRNLQFRRERTKLTDKQIKVLKHIQAGAYNSNTIMHHTGLSRTTVNQTLRQLYQYGLVSRDGKGTKITYQAKGA